MDPRKVLKDLNYRIETADPNDPERENAIRLRDRLLQRYGLKLEDVADVRTRREFGKYVENEQMLVFQYFRKRLKIEKCGVPPYMMDAYEYKLKSTNGRNHSIEIDLTDDEYARHAPIVKNLLEMFAGCMKKLEAQLKEDAKKRRAGTRYAFFEKADLLADAKPGEEAKKRSFSLSDAMRAARDLDGMVFPESHLGQELKALPR